MQITQKGRQTWLFDGPVGQQELHRLIQGRLSVEIIGKAEGVEDDQRGKGIGILGLRSPPEAELAAAPAAVAVLGVQEVAEGPLEAGIGPMAQMAQQVGGVGRLAGIDTAVGIDPEAAVLLPDAEKRCKARKRRLQKRAHTRTYVTDFAACVDNASRNFDLVRGLLEKFLRLRGLSAV